MSYEEQFDRIVRRKVEGAQYPFDDTHWESARKMLDAERRKAAVLTRSRWLWMAGAGSVAALAVWVSVTFSGSNSRQIASAPVAGDIATAIREEANTRPETGTTQPHRQPTAAEKAIAVPPADETGESRKPVTKANPSAASPIASTPPTGIANTSANEPENLKTAVPAEPVAQRAVTEKQEENTESVAPVSTRGWDGEISTPETVEILHGISAQLEYSAEDRNPAIALSPVSYDDYFRKNYRKQFLWVEAGSLYSTGWQVSGTRDANGFNGHFGIGYGRYITKRIALSAGLQAYHVSGIEKPFYQTDGKAYSFGSSPTSTMVTATDLVYAGVPVRVHYVFPAGAQVSAGAHANMLFHATNRVQTNDIRNDLPVSETRTESGVFKGINRANIQLSVAFAYPIARKWKVQAEYVHGLSDVIETDRMAGGRETVNGVRLGVAYTIFDR